MVKRMLVCILLLCVLLCACARRPDPAAPATDPAQNTTLAPGTDAPPPTTTSPIPTTTVAPPPTTTVPDPGTTIEPSPPEVLAPYNDMFGVFGSWYNMALICQYESPKYIDLESLFYLGFEGEHEPTDAEWEEIKKHPQFESYYQYADFNRLPVDKMNAVLETYFGITLGDVDESGFNKLEYLECTGSYYHMKTDANGVENFEAIAVENQADGTVRMYYRSDSHDGIFVATLIPNGDGLRIASNLPVE